MNLENRIQKGSRYIPEERPDVANDPTVLTPELRRKMAAELEEHAAQEIPPEVELADVDELLQSQEYLREERKEVRIIMLCFIVFHWMPITFSLMHGVRLLGALGL